VTTNEEIPFQYEFTASADTARRMARAFLRWRWPSLVRGLLGVFAFYVVLLVYLGDAARWRDRLMIAVVTAFGVAVVVGGGLWVAARIANRRNFSRTVHAGAMMRTGFGETGFVTENELSASRFSYDAVEAVESRDGFVFVRYVGQPMIRTYPEQLFPAGAIDRLRASAARTGTERRKVLFWLFIGTCIVLLAVSWVRHEDEHGFCADLRTLNDHHAALRDAAVREDSAATLAAAQRTADAYQAIDPPPELRRSWSVMIDYYDFVERSARELLQQGAYEGLSDDEDARISVARSRIDDFAVERCGASRAPSDP
jgi:hypothetical protein